MEDPGNLTPRTAIAEYYRSVTPRSAHADRRPHRSYSHEDLAQRQRSNPRTRTPLRNPSPLMIGTTLESLSVLSDDRPVVSEPRNDEGFSINSGDSSQRRTRRSNPAGIITLGAAMPIGTSTHRRMDARRNSSEVVDTKETLTPWKSRKGAPSHRKIRRWNNDRFQISDLSHEFNMRTFHHPDTNKRDYLMPNAPQSYRCSVFSDLDKVEPEIREKIIHGEGGGVQYKCFSDSRNGKQGGLNTGIDNISPRLLPFLTRACQSIHVQKVVYTMEHVLCQYFDSSMKNPTNMEIQIDEILQYLVKKSILVQAPEFIQPSGSTQMKTVRFYFHDKDPTLEQFPSSTGRSSNKNPAFYRLLLHSVGQYHGWQIYTTCQQQTKIMSVMTDGKSCGAPCSLLKVMDIPSVTP